MTDKACSVDGCKRPVTAKGFCSSHYNLMRRYGDTNHRKTPRHEPKNFFYRAITHKSDDCLNWPYGCNGHGYPYVFIDGAQQRANRAMCIAIHGNPKSKELHAAHRCGNRLCINPRHIYWATHLENEEDKARHETHAKGELHGMAKLTEQDVRDIRELYDKGFSQYQIADAYNVKQPHIQRIVTRQSWKHI